MRQEGIEGEFVSIDRLMLAILAVLIADREDKLSLEEPRKTEVVLSQAGLSLGEIAQVTGRKYETVKSAIRRSRTST